MKYFKLVVIMVLFAGLLATTAFAGVAKGVATSNPITAKQVTSSQPTVKSGLRGELEPGAVSKTSSPRSYNKAIASPQPSKLDAALSPKIKQTYSGGLSGTYHIPGDFTSIGAAVAVVNFVGLAGNTIFELDATSYSEPCPMTFGAYTGNGTYTLTIQPGAGVAAVVNLVSSTFQGKGFAFNGASNIAIDGINAGGSSLALQYGPGSVFPDSDGFGATIYITGGSSNISVKNTSIQGIVNDPVWANQTQGRPGVFIWGADADAASNSGITFDGCTITNTTYAIKALAETGVNLSVDGMLLNNNHIGGAYGNPAVQGLWIFWSAHVTISNNIIDGVEFLDIYWNNGNTNPLYTEFDADQTFFGYDALMYQFGYTSALYMAGTDGALVHDNIIRNVSVSGPGGEGLSTYACRVYDYNVGYNIPGLVYNNRIYGISNPGASLLVGFRGTTARFYHNSIQLTGPANGATVTGMNNGGGASKNNAVSVEMTGGAASTRRAIASGGTVDYNAAYSTGYLTSAGPGVAAAAAAGVDVHGTAGPLNFTADLHITTGPSSAEHIGAPDLLAANDIDGDARDTTIAGTRDAGADEFPNTGIAMGIDLAPYVISSPLPGGVPAGLPVPVTVSVKNNTNQAVSGASVTVTINDVPTTFGPEALGTIPSNGAVTHTFASQWTPPAGSWTIAAFTSGVADIDNTNDTLSRSQGVSAAFVIATDSTFHWDASAEGWTGTNDWGSAPRTFLKLGGVYGGSGKSWVTNCPKDSGTYTEGQTANSEGYSAAYPGPNLLISPWFDLSALTSDVFISDLQSIGTEPGWDGSWWEYTLDGVHWKHLGAANDAAGINWYNSSVYQNSPSFTGNPPDTATMKLAQYDIYNSANDNTTVPMGWWSSNGYPGLPNQPAETGQVLGPNGYVFQQLHITSANYPDIVGAHLVKFRLVAFSDAVNPPSTPPYVDTAGARALGIVGWAVDNFHIGPTGTVFAGGSISGSVFLDANANGANDAEPAETGVTVNLLYFGVQHATTTTDGSGNFSFDHTAVDLPGTYSVQVVHAGYAFTTPNPVVVNDPADGSPASIITGISIGDYQGSISGVKWNDLNNDGQKTNGEPGLANWKIYLHKDSCAGAIIDSTLTDSLGNYNFVVLPGAYGVTEQVQNFWRQTFPANNCASITTSTPSGSPNAVITGVNFGNFNLAVLTINKFVDINGNGVDDGGADHTAMPNGASSIIEVKKDGNHFLFDTLGNGQSLAVHAGLDIGVYTIQELSSTAPWYQTLQTGTTFNVTTSGQTQTTEFLNFKAYTITGQKYEDLNGNGVKDAGEPPLAGFTVTIDGSVLGSDSAVTDSNGTWTITGVGGGIHHITEVTPAGWTKTAPAKDSVASNYVVIWTGAGTGVVTAKPIGNFKNICVSGVKYRDFNGNGTRDPGDAGMAGVWIHVSGADSVQTDNNGNYSICNVGPGSHIVTETPGPGYVVTQPAGGLYTVAAASHTDVTGLDFGNFNTNDSSYRYRTFSSDDIEQGAQEKSVKRPNPTKPIGLRNPYIKPNIRNVVDDYFSKTQLGVVQVGLSGVLNAAGKPKAYIYITKAADFEKSLWDKGVTHSAVADSLDVYRGLDFTNKAKLITGKQKSLSPKLQTNDLAEELIVLAFNLGLEQKAKVPAGLGNLVYNDGATEPSECTQYGFPLNGKTVLQIKAIGDNIMTNFEFVPKSCYKRLEEVASNINQAFSCGGVDCENAVEPTVDSTQWVTGAKLFVQGIYPLTAAPYLTSSNGVPPVTPPLWQTLPVPKAFALYQNYPNPFNPTTTITFDLPEASNVTLKIYNILGQEVATLLDHAATDAGNQAVDFDASRLASGVYLYRIVAEQLNNDGSASSKPFTQVKKMVLLK